MKSIALSLLSIILLQQVGYKSYGEIVDQEGAIETNALIQLIDSEDKNFKVKGVVEEVCQMKGCWLTLKNDQGKSIRITFKDYGFFVPKDISGKEVIIEGTASLILQTEDVARHYAEDVGKDYNESMRKEISFVANGVLVKES